MEDEIQERLTEIEKAYNIRILYACEAGSRLWGYASVGSDRDVRFVYAHPLEWYLSIEEGPDTLEIKPNDLLDLSGWELKKTLKLYKKSNPSLLEMLHSHIILRKHPLFFERLKQMEALLFSKKTCLIHYLNMAQTNYKKWQKDATPSLKHYFHVIRPLLMCRWISTQGQMPPLQLFRLAEDCPTSIKEDIHRLIQKQMHQESVLKTDALFKSLNGFVEENVVQIKNQLIDVAPAKGDDPTPLLNQLFRSTITTDWN